MNTRRTTAAIWEFLAEEDGPTAVEYAVMIGAILAVCIAAVVFMGTKNSESFEASSTAIASAVN